MPKAAKRAKKTDASETPLGSTRLAFVGGGVMAEAIIGGLLAGGIVTSGQIVASHPREERRARLEALTQSSRVRPVRERRQQHARRVRRLPDQSHVVVDVGLRDAADEEVGDLGPVRGEYGPGGRRGAARHKRRAPQNESSSRQLHATPLARLLEAGLFQRMRCGAT